MISLHAGVGFKGRAEVQRKGKSILCSNVKAKFEFSNSALFVCSGNTACMWVRLLFSCKKKVKSLMSGVPADRLFARQYVSVQTLCQAMVKIYS